MCAWRKIMQIYNAAFNRIPARKSIDYLLIFFFFILLLSMCMKNGLCVRTTNRQLLNCYGRFLASMCLNITLNTYKIITCDFFQNRKKKKNGTRYDKREIKGDFFCWCLLLHSRFRNRCKAKENQYFISQWWRFID